MKRRFIKKIICINLILSMIIYNAVSVFATNEELNKITNSQNMINKIQKQKKEVEKTLKNLQTLKSDTEKYIETLDNTLDALTTELNSIIDKIDEKQVEINVINIDLNNAKEEEQKQYNDMRLRIKYFYENSNSTAIDNALAGDNLSDMLTRSEYVQNITDYDRKKLDDLVLQKEKIIDLENNLQKEKQELIDLKEEETSKKETIEELLFTKQQELSDTNNAINKSQKELDKLLKDQKAQEDNIKQIEAQIEAREKESKRVLKGGMLWPLPTSHRITSPFGKRSSPTKGASTYHEGIDIGDSVGNRVNAAASGEVVISKYSYSAGNYIMISHGSKVYTVYMHLSKRSVNVGDEVAIGQKIGEVGSTGYSTGPHLHFGIRKDGKYVNPLTYVG